MSGAWFLRSHAVLLLCDAAVLVLLRLLLLVMGVGHDATALALVCCGLLLALGALWEWLRERKFVRALANLADEGDNVFGAADELPESDFPEARATRAAIANVARASQQEVGRAQDQVRDYRRYVETWVHEIKTPIAACNLMLENRHDPTLRPLAREVARIEAYVEQALYYARSFSVEKDYLVRDCDLGEVVRAALRSRASSLIEARMSVDLGPLAKGDALHAFCDPKWMEFVLGQLVDNAVRYRCDPKRDGRAPTLSFDVRLANTGKASEQVVLSVLDNGCGISAEDLGRVFDRGFTGTNGRTHQRSTGMGLYLVRTLCKKMGLAVSAQSDGTSWTCVSIVFPQNRSRFVD